MDWPELSAIINLLLNIARFAYQLYQDYRSGKKSDDHSSDSNPKQVHGVMGRFLSINP